CALFLSDRARPQLPLHSRSMLASQMEANNLYIEAGIWLVSPFADPSLYAYCQGLPPQFRSNKNVLRIYHAACRFPGIVFSASKERDFEQVSNSPLLDGHYDGFIQALSDFSYINRLGYANQEKFLKTYHGLHMGSSRQDFSSILLWLKTE